MYPARSSAKSSAPGSLWWREGSGVIAATQFDALVRAFQSYASATLPSYFPLQESGDCDASAAARSALNGNWYSRDGVAPTGVWNPASHAALTWLMCRAGAPQAARYAVFGEFRSRSVGPTTLQWVVLFAYYGGPVADAGLGSIPLAVDPSSVWVRPDTELPDLDAQPVSAPEDAAWIARWSPATEQPPTAPSLFSQTPSGTSGSTGGTIRPAQAPALAQAPGWFEGDAGKYAVATAAGVAAAGLIAGGVWLWLRRK